jgi:tight adherence protein C
MIATIILVVIVLAILGGAIMLVVIGLRDSRENDPLQDRLAEFAERGQQATLEEIELSQPLTERIIFPLARRIGEIVMRFTPQNALQATAQKLELAGNPKGLEPATFWALRIIMAVVIAGFMIFIFTVGSMKWSLSRKVLITAAFVGLGFYVPEMLLTSRIQRRQQSVRKAMPDALDLLTICVEAGLGFDGAMQKVSEKWENELSLAFSRVIREIQLGKLRREALRDMADRVGIPEMTSFVAAIIQSEQLGVSMAKVLRIQADQMRMKRRQHAEELAHQAPVKMLIPMALLIFPSICIVLMAPSVFMMMRSALKGVLFGGG